MTGLGPDMSALNLLSQANLNFVLNKVIIYSMDTVEIEKRINLGDILKNESLKQSFPIFLPWLLTYQWL